MWEFGIFSVAGRARLSSEELCTLICPQLQKVFCNYQIYTLLSLPVGSKMTSCSAPLLIKLASENHNLITAATLQNIIPMSRST